MSVALPDGPRGRILALGLTIAVVGGVWAGVVQPMIDWYGERATRLDERESLARRMEAISATLPLLQRDAAAATRSGPTASALLGGDSDAIAAARLQEIVQGLAAKSGANLTSQETLPPEAAGAYRRIQLRVALNAPYPVLANLIDAIETASPPILVDDVRMSGSRIVGRPGNNPLDVTFTIIAFRAGAQGSPSPNPAGEPVP